ncbi:ATPase [Rhizocola hellebori]|uniref:ATPase n=1 Tax=Rhizocola hellebori TaxID=1392758 RepID=A0A8J3Q6K8_9ACTN|nr:SRPBCC family protein [Rhizocola hellebori]GIH04251.1 ATPase [Rhizocola hellebori]
MGTKNELTVTMQGDTEIVMTRVFDAPRQAVFEAHSSCEHITQWWGQPGDKLGCEMDFREGGRYRFVQHKQDGSELAFRGEYREIKPFELLVQTFEFEGMPGHIAVERLVFEEHDGKTTVISTTDYGTTEDRDGIVASGMETGAAQAYNQLEEYLLGRH